MTDLATAGSDALVEWERYRRELTGYCYRMLGSSADAEDAVQDTMVRAWKAYDKFEGRSSERSWLYRIATNVCLTLLETRKRRERPVDLGPVGSAEVPLPEPNPEISWLEPVPAGRVLPEVADPAEVAVGRESIRLAFVAALQHLPARQRAVLILREVLQWKAAEVAELLETSVASVNSALQRARATLAEQQLHSTGPVDDPMDEEHQKLLARYAEAFERYDITTLVTLLHEDAVMSMPPHSLWLQGPAQISAWWTGQGAGCEGSRMLLTWANGLPAFGQYRPDPEGGHFAWGLQVLEIRDSLIRAKTTFLDVDTLFPMFGLPMRLEP